MEDELIDFVVDHPVFVKFVLLQAEYMHQCFGLIHNLSHNMKCCFFSLVLSKRNFILNLQIMLFCLVFVLFSSINPKVVYCILLRCLKPLMFNHHFFFGFIRRIWSLRAKSTNNLGIII